MSVQHVKVFKGIDNDWYWQALAGNGQIVATAGEGYRNRGDCVHMANVNYPDAPIEIEKPASRAASKLASALRKKPK